MLTNLLQDLKYSVRGLHKSLGFTAIAVLIMGLGIGANTAIFSFVNAILLQQTIPYKNPSNVVRICSTTPKSSAPAWISYPDFCDFRDRTDLFSSAAAASDGTPMSLLTNEGSEFVIGEAFSSDLFSIMDMPPSMGRSFLPEEDKPGCSPVVMISHSAWESRFGRDPNILGKELRINGHPVTVVGVGPKEFRGTLVIVFSDYWLSLGTAARVEPSQINLENRRSEYRVYARLKPGVSIEQARARLNSLAESLAREYPATNADRGVLVMPASEVRLDPLLDKALFPLSGFLMAVVGLVLVVACSNLAGLLLIRASSRGKEVAVRLALGASRGRLLRQLLTDSTLLGLLGGAVGLIFALWMASALASYKPPLPVVLTINSRLDGTVLAYTLVISVMTGILFGLAPALRASRCDIMGILKDEAPLLNVGRRRFSLRNVLIVVQFAVSLALLLAAALFIRTLIHALRTDPGFRPEDLAAATIDLSLSGHKEEAEGRAFFEHYAQSIASVPGVRGVALASCLPLVVWGNQKTPVRLPGAQLETDKELPRVDFTVVNKDYFDVMGIPIQRGRNFNEGDIGSRGRVVIVSEAMAQRFWGSVEVIGKTIVVGETGRETQAEVIGVARDTKVMSLKEEPQPFLYLAFSQRYSPRMMAIVRTAGNPAGMPEAFRRNLRNLDRLVPMFEARTMSEYLGLQLYGPRMAAILLSALGLLALVVAGIGLYGLVAFTVAQRTREVGIRIALGAQGSQVIAMILRQGIGLLGVALALGLPLAILVMLPLSNVLKIVSATDPIAIAAVILLLALVTLLASYLPARNAARVDPLVSLRHE